MQTVILTSDVSLWAVQPQLWLIEKYWKRHGPITIGGYTRPEFALPVGVEFYSIGKFEDYPVQRWTDGLIKLLDSIEDEVILFLMDDYWLFRDVDDRAIHLMTEYMLTHVEVKRFCVCTDRLGAAGITDYMRLGHLDVIKSDPESPYHFSYQASLWQRRDLLDYLAPNETPWESEMSSDTLFRRNKALVLGTRQAPMRYTIALQQGKFTPDGGYQTPNARMNPDDFDYITRQHWIPAEVLA